MFGGRVSLFGLRGFGCRVDGQSVGLLHVQAGEFVAVTHRHPMQGGQRALHRKGWLALEMVTRGAAQCLWGTR